MANERVEVRILALRHERPGGHAVDLVEMTFPMNAPGRSRRLSIFIGPLEAEAIRLGIEKRQLPRPLTHDLLQTAIDEMGYELEFITIVDVVERVFHAELSLAPKDLAAGVGGSTTEPLRKIVIGCRPSDALALAIRTNSPLFVNESVLSTAGYEETEEALGEDSVLAEFKDFIDNISPEDFSE